MISMRCLLLLLMLSGISLPAQDSSISYGQLGFSFTPPEPAQPGPGTVVLAFLPPLHDFAPNVNVLVQPYSATLQDYDQLTQGQFKHLQMTVISQEVKPDHLRYEYRGLMSGRQLHFYARALKRMDAVYLITATDLEEDWAADKELLIHSVDSLVLTPQHP